jgi:hypothetical protein
MQGTVGWEQLIFVVSAISTCGMAVAGFVVWLWSKLSASDKEHRKSIDDMRKAHSDLRVEIAEKYVPNAELGKVESRIETTLAAMAQQFERGFDRLTDMISKIAGHTN